MGKHDAGGGDKPFGSGGSGGGDKPFDSGPQGQEQQVDPEALQPGAQEYHVDLEANSPYEQAQQMADATRAAGTAMIPAPFGSAMSAGLLGTADYLQPGVKQLAEGQEHLFPAPSPPQIQYMGVDHADLANWVKKTDPGSVGSMGSAWSKTGRNMEQAQLDVMKGITDSQEGWSGNDAEKARNAVARIARKTGGISHGSKLAGAGMEQQSEALSTARSSMPDPPENPYDPDKAAAHLQTLKDDPVAYHHQLQDYRAQAHHEKVLHQQAADVMQTYDHTTAQVGQKQPAFAPPPPGSGGSGGGGGGGAAHEFDVGGGTQVDPSSYSGGAGGGGGSQYGGGNGGGHTSPIPGGGTGGTSGGSTHTGPSNHGPGGPIPGPGGPGGPGGPNGPGHGRRGRNGEPVPGPIPGGGGTGTGGGTGSGTGRGGRYGGGRGAGTGAGAGSEGGRAGAGRSGAGRAGALGEGGKSANGAGGRSGAGRAGAGAAEEAAMGRGGAGGGRGGRGMGMMPRGGKGGKGGKGEDDYEHNSPSWLIEPDKDTLFGCDQKTAPPVIGDWWGEHDPRRNSNNNQNTDDED